MRGGWGGEGRVRGWFYRTRSSLIWLCFDGLRCVDGRDHHTCRRHRPPHQASAPEHAPHGQDGGCSCQGQAQWQGSEWKLFRAGGGRCGSTGGERGKRTGVGMLCRQWASMGQSADSMPSSISEWYHPIARRVFGPVAACNNIQASSPPEYGCAPGAAEAHGEGWHAQGRH